MKRDARIADLLTSQRRLQDLFEIGKLLLRFETVERTVPAVMALVSHSVPLRSAIFLQNKGGAHALLFRVEGAPPRQLEEAKSHLTAAYRYLVPNELAIGLESASPLVLPASRSSVPGSLLRESQQLVLLPLVGHGGAIFGALQVAGMEPMGEQELMFLDAIVNQLATALDRDASERALRDSEAKLAGIIAMAMDAVITFDATLHISMFNEGAERIFGWSSSEVLGKPLELLLPTRFCAAHGDHVRRFRDSPDTARRMGAVRPEIFGRRKNGQEFHADVAISKLNVGGAWLYTVFLRDISEQRRIEHEKAFLAEVTTVLSGTLDKEETLGNIARLAMGSIGDFCVIEFVDERGEQRRLDVLTSDANKACVAQALKHFPLDRARPHLSSVLLASGQAQLITEVSPELVRSFAQDDEHLRLYEAMGIRSVMGVPLLVGGRLLGALIVGNCRPEPAFREVDLQLLMQVGQRAALALESARLYRVVQHAVQVRDDVLGVVAHDLRNPLGSILMQTQLSRRKGGEPERRSGRALDVIERAAKRMNRLIQDLLDITSLDAGKLSIDCAVVNARQVLLDVLESQQALGLSSSLELRLDATPSDLELWADRERLLQVLENLLGNATKFTSPGGVISVGARRQGSEAVFWVADTGVGVTEEDLPHLFDRFWQVRKAERRGAGLGLAIVKGLVESHGGRIWVESAVGVGSTFYFSIPTIIH